MWAVFRTCGRDDQQGEVAAKYILSRGALDRRRCPIRLKAKGKRNGSRGLGSGKPNKANSVVPFAELA